MIPQSNQDVREAIKKAKIRNWQLAAFMGCHENTVYRMLRQELPPEKKAELLKIIEQLKEEHDRVGS